MAVSWITAIYIFSLEMDREVHPVGILQKSPNATITPICALAFVAKCNWIITAEESGTGQFITTSLILMFNFFL